MPNTIPRIRAIVKFIVEAIVVLGGLACILTYLDIKPPWVSPVQEKPVTSLATIPAQPSHGTGWLILGLLLIAIALVSSGYSLYRNLKTSEPPDEGAQNDPNLILVADASRDFSADFNPCPPWSYGYYRGGLDGDFLPHKEKKPNLFRGVSVWESTAIDVSLSVMHHCSRNWTEGTVPSYAIPPDAIYMHPGQNGTYVVVRWTCQQAGRYRIWCEFRGLDVQTTKADSDIDIRHNLRSLCEVGKVNLNGIGTVISHKSEVLDLKVRDTIDFVVGCGQGGRYDCDSTALKAKIYQSKTGT